MNEIKLITMDMDGTLLGKEPNVIPPENIKALQLAHERGIHLALASGRCADDLSFFAKDAGLPMHILGTNASVICLEPFGEVIADRCLPRATARAIDQLLLSSGLPYAAYCCHDIHMVTPPAYTKEFEGFRWGTFTTREGGRTRLLTDHELLESALHRVNKFVMYADGIHDALVVLGQEISACFPDADAYFSGTNTLEIMPKGVDKGSGLTELARLLGISMSQVMALGDSENDIPMLKAAGIGVAMGNALPSVKDVAGYETRHHLEAGVATAIRALALGEDVPGVKKLKQLHRHPQHSTADKWTVCIR